MKQGFYRSEAFELGEPGQLNMGERRHRRTPRRVEPMLIRAKRNPPVFLEGVGEVYIRGWVFNRLSL